MKLKKIVISGVGGVGGYYGSMLNEYSRQEGLGREIHFLARGEHLERIRQHGLHLTTPSKDLYVHPTSVSNQAEDIGPVDLVILATKSYDLAENIEQIKPLLHRDTIVLPLLNGANISAQIQELLPPRTRVWQGCCYISARRPQAGEVMLENDRELLYFGSSTEIDKADQTELLNLMLSSGINAHNPEDISLVIRKKFMMISATATGTSYFDANIGKALAEHPKEMKALIEEVCTLSTLEGYDLGEDAVEKAMQRQLIMPYESTSSMHVDFRNGARTELENLSGYVVHKAQELGLEVPTYRMMYEALKSR